MINGTPVEISGNVVVVDLDNTNQSLKNSFSGLIISNRIGYWKLDENSGNTAYDSEGNSNGQITGAQWTTGINQSALDFDGTTGNVEIPSNDILN